jgi:hypothetical protein
MATKTASKAADEKDPVPVVTSPGVDPVKTSELQPLDMSPKRAYQTTAEPGQREYLTQAEAEKRGFHWAETDEEQAASSDGRKRKRR